MLYVRALEKVLNERDIKKWSQYAQVKRVGETTLQEIRVSLQNQQVSETESGRSTPSAFGNSNSKGEDESGDKQRMEISGLLQNEDGPIKIDSEKYFIPFELACGGESPAVTIAALDGLQKLLAHGQITGNYSNPGNPNKKLIDRIVETICSCHNGSETDEGVELQIIKALLTIVTSQYVQIHEGTVLLTLRTCYNIYLTTRNTVNQTTARAMLTQMLHSIFTRMEASFEGSSNQVIDSFGENNNNLSETTDMLETVTRPLKDWEWESIKWYSLLDLSISTLGNDNSKQLSGFQTFDQDGQDLHHEKNRSSAEPNEFFTDDHGTDRAAHLDSNCNLNLELSKDVLLEDQPGNGEILAYPAGINPFEENLLGFEDSKDINRIENSSATFIHVLQKDAFLTFWALCKLALKSNATDELSVDSSKMIDTKSKILSFQLLKSVMENCGELFKTSPIFVTAIKQYLVAAMSQAGVSNITEVFQLNIDLLRNLIKKFRNSLKEEIEILCGEILLPVLDPSSQVSAEYKLLVLGAINKLCSDIKCLIDIYINYDLPGSSNSKMFERITNHVCNLSQEKKDVSNLTADSLRILALETLLTLLKNMAISCTSKKELNASYVDVRVGSTDPKCQPRDHNPTGTLPKEENPVDLDFTSGLFSLLENISSSIEITEIDLLIQKFSQQMANSAVNREKFESGDCLYALVYSAINLIGELSNKAQSKFRISKEQFLKMNRGLNGCEPLPEDYLGKVYDEIEAYLFPSSSNRKRQLCEKSENVVNTAKRLIVKIGLPQSSVSSEKQIRYVRRMFKVMGKSVLAALLGILTECDDTDTTLSDDCLYGIQSAIRIASVLNLKNERDAFVQSLSRLSLAALKEIKSKNLNAKIITSKTSSTTTTENGVTKTTVTTTTETKCRNVDIIQTLLNVAITEGNYLGNAWLDTLKCISQLQAAQLLEDSSSRNSSRSGSPNPNTQAGRSWYTWAGSFVPSFWDSSGNKLDMASVRESMGILVHKIFSESTRLDGNAIVDFFKALCQVSLIEITHPENPRSFVYEKIFEVAHVNMGRTCLQWSSIWQVLSDYFSHLACSSDEEVSFFAIDSVTKLSVYLLEKETIGNFRFQDNFLQPFETIIRNTPFNTTREYVLECITKIVKSNSFVLRSGWRPILRILEMYVYDDHFNNSAVAFAMIRNILDMFQNGEVNLIDSLEEVIRCLKDFAFKAPSLNIQYESMELLKKIAQLINDKPELLVDLDARNMDSMWTNGWSHLFRELSNVVLDAETDGFDADMQSNALVLFFEMIKTYGGSFNQSWWKSLFQILFRIFNKLKFHEENIVANADDLADEASLSNKGNYNHFYCYYYVQFAIVDTFIRYYDVVGSILLEDLLKELQWCILQDHQQIALSGVQCLHQVIGTLSERFTTNDWNVICKLIQDLIQWSFPGENKSSNEIHAEKTQNTHFMNPIVQLELLKLMKIVLFSRTEVSDIPEEKYSEATDNEKQVRVMTISSEVIRGIFTGEQMFLLLGLLDKAHQYAKNAVDIKQFSSQYIPHETLSLESLLKLLFQMYTEKSLSTEDLEKIQTQLFNIISSTLEQFATFSTERQDSMTEPIEFCLKSIIDLPSNKFKMVTSMCYPFLCEMLEMELKPELNSVLCKYFLTIGRSIDIFRGVYTAKLLENHLRASVSSNNVSTDDLENNINFQISLPISEITSNSQSV